MCVHLWLWVHEYVCLCMCVFVYCCFSYSTCTKYCLCICIHYYLSYMYYLLPVTINFFSLNLQNVGEHCKAQWVCVHQNIALYKGYLLLLLLWLGERQVRLTVSPSARLTLRIISHPTPTTHPYPQLQRNASQKKMKERKALIQNTQLIANTQLTWANENPPEKQPVKVCDSCGCCTAATSVSASTLPQWWEDMLTLQSENTPQFLHPHCPSDGKTC